MYIYVYIFAEICAVSRSEQARNRALLQANLKGTGN